MCFACVLVFGGARAAVQVGSLIYMAPELLVSQWGGRFTDWWALGVLAHELLTGCSPWSSLADKRLLAAEIATIEVGKQYKNEEEDASLSFILGFRTFRSTLVRAVQPLPATDACHSRFEPCLCVCASSFFRCLTRSGTLTPRFRSPRGAAMRQVILSLGSSTVMRPSAWAQKTAPT